MTQGRDHDHDGAEAGPGAADRGAVFGEGGPVLHPGRKRRQDRDAQEGEKGAGRMVSMEPCSGNFTFLLLTIFEEFCKNAWIK